MKRLDLPQLQAAIRGPFEVVGIPLATPGYYVVEIESLRLGASLLDKKAPMYVRTGVLVTNLGVHFKRGRENSLVWVTTLDKGKPVEGADVAVNDCRGRQIFAGRTDAQGLARIDARARRRSRATASSTRATSSPRARPIAAGRRRASSTRASSSARWQKGIESWRFNVPTDFQPRARSCARTRCSTARCCARAKRCR